MIRTTEDHGLEPEVLVSAAHALVTLLGGLNNALGELGDLVRSVSLDDGRGTSGQRTRHPDRDAAGSAAALTGHHADLAPRRSHEYPDSVARIPRLAGKGLGAGG